MVVYITLGIILVFMIVLFFEFLSLGNINDFIDKKILRRFLWIWLPFYALWRLTKEVFFKHK